MNFTSFLLIIEWQSCCLFVKKKTLESAYIEALYKFIFTSFLYYMPKSPFGCGFWLGLGKLYDFVDYMLSAIEGFVVPNEVRSVISVVQPVNACNYISEDFYSFFFLSYHVMVWGLQTSVGLL